MQDNFKSNLLSIKKELANHHRDKSQLGTYYLQERLAESLKTYYKEVKNSYLYLEQRDEMKIIKKMNRYE